MITSPATGGVGLTKLVYCPKKALSVKNRSGCRALTVICGNSDRAER
jgi:hypothetical protein